MGVLRLPGVAGALLVAWLVLAGLFTATTGALAALAPVPPLAARVNDLTGTLRPEQRARLEAQLADIEARKGAQVVLLLVETTQPEPIEAYSIRVAEAWKIGRGEVGGRRVDDGVLVVVAKADRAVRIEVGYGLEGAIPDAIAKRIIEEAIVPRFRAGDFFGGLGAAVFDLGRLIDGEPLPAPVPVEAGIGMHWIAGLGIVFFLGGILRAVFGRLAGATIGACVAGVVGWFFGATLLALPAIVVVAFLLLLVGAGAGGRRGGPGWTGGSPGGFGGGSGGGFSGGGGSFGGGGASGRW